MKMFLYAVAASALASAAASSAVTHIAVSAAARSDQTLAIRQLQSDNAALRLELDALRRDLMRRPVPPAGAPAAPNPDLIPAQNLPTAPNTKE